MKKNAAFKPYQQHQMTLLPINLDELMPENHMVRVIDRAIEKMNCEPLFAKYEGGGTSSHTDATFMRMKEDHMKNGQLKPGYNVQIGTENRFITGFSVHQKARYSTLLKEHLEHLKSLHNGTIPKTVIADAGYGGQENYKYFLEENVIPYLL